MSNSASGKSWLASKSILVAIAVLTLLSGIYLLNAKSSNKKRGRINPAFASYISAHTAGSISRASSIRIQLANNFGDSTKIGEELNVFSFEPSIKGKAHWVNASTIEFIPAEPLPSGQEYEASFLLDKIIEVPDELEEFEFDFKVISQDFEVGFPTFETLDPLKLQYQRLSGTLSTADIEDDSKIEQLLKISQGGKFFHVKWEHAADKRTHRYIVDSLLRKNIETEALIEWNGSSLNLDKKGEHKVKIPAIGDFSAINAMVVNDGAQYINVYFSDPILPGQDLSGLIHFDRPTAQANVTQIDLKFTIDGHYVRCYPNVTLSGSYPLYIEAGIQNTLGYKLKTPQTLMVTFADVMPSVNILGKGVIMPSSNKLLLPFEAVGLRAVDVTVTRIYENNVAQFLQVNDLKTDRELARVGRPMIKKMVPLNGDKLTDLGKVNTFNLNLDDLIRTEPGAIYQVKITFKKEYSMYRCVGEEANDEESEMKSLEEEENWDGDAKQQADASFWDYSDEYYSDDYNWNETTLAKIRITIRNVGPKEISWHQTWASLQKEEEPINSFLPSPI
jgi:hypothetical protein